MKVSKRKKRIKKESKEEKNKKVSASMKKGEVERALMAREQLLVLIYKNVYFTNDLNSSLPCEVVSLLHDVFPEEITCGLPPLRGIEHQIDFILGASLPNRPAYRSSPEEAKEIQRQVDEFLQKGFLRESLSPCSVDLGSKERRDMAHVYRLSSHQ